MPHSNTTNGQALIAAKRPARTISSAPVEITAPGEPSGGHKAVVIQVEHDATLTASSAAQIVAGNDMKVQDSGAMLMVANRDLHIEDSGSSVMLAGRDLTLKNGGAALMAAGNSLTATNAGAGILWAGANLTVQHGAAPVQAAGQTATTEDQKTILVAGRTVNAAHSTVALAIGYDVHIAKGSQAIVAVSLRSFVDTLVGVAFFAPVQVSRRLRRRA